jgi:hypothetical protein
VPRDELSGQSPSRCDAHLLTENCSNAQLESIPAAGSTQAGTRRDERSQAGIMREMHTDRLNVRVDIEQTTDAQQDRGQGSHVRKADGDAETLLVGTIHNANETNCSVNLDCALIACPVNALDAGNGSRLKVREHRRPIVGWPVPQSQRDALAGGAETID